MKTKMTKKLHKLRRPADFQPGQAHFNPVAAHLQPDRPYLSEFLKERSLLMFNLFSIDAQQLNLLRTPSEDCVDNQCYTDLQHQCHRKDMQVVKDASERTVKAVQDAKSWPW